jgi:hypothetical protein
MFDVRVWLMRDGAYVPVLRGRLAVGFLAPAGVWHTLGVFHAPAGVC